MFFPKNHSKTVILDGYALVFRGYYAFHDLKNANDEPIGAIHGLVLIILGLIERSLICPGFPIVVAFDKGSRSGTFRHDIFAQYKTNRPPLPNDLFCQLQFIRKTLDAFGITYLEMHGLEADDIIASLVNVLTSNVIVVTSDKDLLQLVNDEKSIAVYDPTKSRLMTEAAVYERMGVYPKQLCDYLAIVGDSADNIPGLPGIGPKTGARLLQQCGSLEEIYHMSTKGLLSPTRMNEVLRDNIELALLYRKLTQLKSDIALPDRDMIWLGLKQNHPNISQFIEERGLQKIQSKYLLLLCNEKT